MTITENLTTSTPSLLQYYVYTLTDPIDNAVFYVGCSIDTRNRLYGHIAESKQRSDGKSKAIKRILKTGAQPVLEVIDTIAAIDPIIAHHVEQYWILKMQNDGHPLTNRNDATPSWMKMPPYSTIEYIKTIAHLPLSEFRDMLAEYHMRGAGKLVLTGGAS